MTITTRVLLVATAVLGLALGACGDDDDTDTTTETTSSTTTADATAPDGPATFEVFLTPADLGDDCSAVVASEREAQAGGDVSEALTQLLAGPTAEEAANGLGGWFSEDTEGLINSVEVNDGVAEVDFADFSGIIPNASTSCGSGGLLAQLDSTVLQFPEIDEVVYSFDGDRVAFYEWLQLSAPE